MLYIANKTERFSFKSRCVTWVAKRKLARSIALSITMA